MKNLSGRDLSQPDKDVLAKGLNFAATPEEIPAVDLMESVIKNNQLTETEAEQLRLKVSATLTRAKAPASNLTIQERMTLASLQQDGNIAVLPADKRRCTVVLNTAD